MSEEPEVRESRHDEYNGRHDSNALTLLAISTAFLAAIMLIADVPDILVSGNANKNPLNVAAALLAIAAYGMIAWAVRAIVTMDEESRETPNSEKRDLLRRSFNLLMLMAGGTGLFMTATAIFALLS